MKNIAVISILMLVAAIGGVCLMACEENEEQILTDAPKPTATPNQDTPHRDIFVEVTPVPETVKSDGRSTCAIIVHVFYSGGIETNGIPVDFYLLGLGSIWTDPSNSGATYDHKTTNLGYCETIYHAPESGEGGDIEGTAVIKVIANNEKTVYAEIKIIPPEGE